jgi:hypothetical protein
MESNSSDTNFSQFWQSEDVSCAFSRKKRKKEQAFSAKTEDDAGIKAGHARRGHKPEGQTRCSIAKFF